MRTKIQDWIATLGLGKVNPRQLYQHINTVILPDIAPSKRICLSTATNWLDHLGYSRSTYKKGVYIDGHKRQDNIDYRQNLFLPCIEEHEAYAVRYDDKTSAALPLALLDGSHRRHLIFHDECYFHANDRETNVWIREGEQALRQKGRGRGVHVSGFIYKADGFLKLTDTEIAQHNALPKSQQLRKTDSTVIIYPGKNADPWWDMKQLQAQLEHAIDLFELKHPNDQAVFIFDQSTAHGAFADDALVASCMNVNPGGKQPAMHSTIIPMDNAAASERGKPQSMVGEDGKPKGMEEVLKERRLFDLIHKGSAGRPVGKCKSCKTSEDARTALEKRARELLEQDPESYGSLSAYLRCSGFIFFRLTTGFRQCHCCPQPSVKPIKQRSQHC